MFISNTLLPILLLNISYFFNINKIKNLQNLMFKFIFVIGLVGAFDVTTKCSCVQIGNADDCEMNSNC